MSMREGVCPECGGIDIYTRGGWFNNVIVAFLPPKTTIYVCGTCGYLAEFIEQGGHLDYVRNNWDKLDVKRKNEVLVDVPPPSDDETNS